MIQLLSGSWQVLVQEKYVATGY